MSIAQTGSNQDIALEFAPAKINLFLHIEGRRPDGYHELLSLVCFADIGDELQQRKGGAFSLTTEYDLNQEILGPNLIQTAFEKLSAHFDLSEFGTVHLKKHLPIASGIGGGSSDAAAFLRLARQYLGAQASGFDWQALALELGADVPVCLQPTTQLMGGIGEVLSPIDNFPPLYGVLANPNIAVSSAAIFEALNAPPSSKQSSLSATVLDQELKVNRVRYLLETRNDLQPIACEIAPQIGELLHAMGGLDGNVLARMSGSGATCFALFNNETAAVSAAAQLQDQFQIYWVKSVCLGAVG